MTFELMLDYGAYRDLQRHRLLTPATQRLTCRLGFETPPDLTELGHAEAYQDAMLAARDAWQPLEESHPLEAQYGVPLGYRVRTLWTLNLRELFHVIELRSAKQGHTSYRRIAQGLYRTAITVHPWLKALIRVDLNDYARARS
jgi:thymidylate synthase ThyX